MWIFPLTAAAVSAVFAALLSRAWSGRRQANLLAWAIALAMFAVASLATAAGMLFGWTPAWFRVYYLFGAILNVPVLALGTLYLLAPRAAAHLFAVVVLVASVWAILAVDAAPLNEQALRVSGVPAGSEVVSEGVRSLSRYYSYVGALIVFGGAVWSALRLVGSRELRLKRLAGANLLIAAGVLIVAAASGFARYGRGSIFAVGLAAGVVMMFWGFLRTRPDSA